MSPALPTVSGPRPATRTPRHRRRRAVGLLAALALVPVGALAQPSATSADTGDNPVVVWSGVAEAAITASRPPASSTVLAAMVHGAIYDAVAAVTGDLEPFVTPVTAPAGASVDAAVAQAAHDVLVARVPGQAGSVQTTFDSYLAAIPDGPAKQAGVAAGSAAAAGMLASRSGDHGSSYGIRSAHPPPSSIIEIR